QVSSSKVFQVANQLWAPPRAFIRTWNLGPLEPGTLNHSPHILDRDSGTRRDRAVDLSVGWARSEREDAPAARLFGVPGVEIEQELGRSEAEQPGADDVGEPMGVVTHTPEAVEERQGIRGGRNSPVIVEALADTRRQREQWSDVAGDE